MKTLTLLAILLISPLACLSKGIQETYEYKLILLGENGLPLANQTVNIIKHGHKYEYYTDRKGIIKLEIVYSTKCASTMSTFNRIFNNRPEWTSKYFEIEYNGFHRKLRKNWKRMFRNKRVAVETYSLSKKRFV